MADSRTLTALAGIVLSIAASVALFLYTGSVLFFLFVPFVPFLFRASDGSSGTKSDGSSGTGPAVKRCDRCGFRTTDDSHEYCPRDGSRLYEEP